MAKSKEETALVVDVEALLTPVELKQVATKGEDGQFIQLANIDHTKQILTDLATKYKALIVTKENYKTDGVEAERVLRNSRYALQRIHKSNNSFLNEVKAKEKETYDGLIKIIKPEEKRLYDDVKAFKELAKRQKAEQEAKEKERVDKIELALKETEFALEKAVIQGRTREDLERYDEFLKEIEEKFENFEEFEFQIKRLHAVYTAKRGQIDAQIKEQEDLQKQKAEQEAKAKAEQEHKERVIKAREQGLIAKGFKIVEGAYKGYNITLTIADIEWKDEVEWYIFLTQVDESIAKQKAEQEAKAKAEQEVKQKAEQEAKAKAEQEAKESLLQALADWDKLVKMYGDLGGDVKIWRLKKDEVPSSKDVQSLVNATKELQKKQKSLKLKNVKEDITPFKDTALEFLKSFENMLKNADFKNKKSREILESYKQRSLDLVNEVFGEVYNK